MTTELTEASQQALERLKIHRSSNYCNACEAEDEEAIAALERALTTSQPAQATPDVPETDFGNMATQQAAGEPVVEPFGWVCRYLCHADDDGEQRWTDWHFTSSSESVPPKWSRGSYAAQEAVPVSTRPAPGVPEGFALVPVEPTEEMINAGVDAALLVADDWCSGDERKNPHIERWKAMLAAAQAKGGEHG